MSELRFGAEFCDQEAALRAGLDADQNMNLQQDALEKAGSSMSPTASGAKDDRSSPAYTTEPSDGGSNRAAKRERCWYRL